MQTNSDWWKKWKVLGMATGWQNEPCLWDRDTPADWLTDSLSGSPELFLLKCWNLRFFIVLWKGSLPVMQETEWLPCSKNARFPGSIPWAPSPDRSQNISSFRIQGHCIFILILFFSLNGSRKLSGSSSSSSGPGCVCYPEPGLMFRLAVTSSALQCVTDAEDHSWQQGIGSVEMWSRPAVCVCVLVLLRVQAYQSCALPHTHPRPHLCAFVLSCIWTYFRHVKRSKKGPATSVLIKHQHVWTVCFSNTSVSALRLLSVRMDPHIYLQSFPPSLCLPLPRLSPSSANSQHL